jgi:hypothetical protein
LDPTHTKVEAGSDPGPLACRPHQPYCFPIRHPHEIARSERLDRELEKVRFFYHPNSSFRRCISLAFQLLPSPIRRQLSAIYHAALKMRQGYVSLKW